MLKDPTADLQIKLRKAFLEMILTSVERVTTSMQSSGVLDEDAMRVVSTFMPKETTKTFLAPIGPQDRNVPFEVGLLESMANSGVALEDAGALVREIAAAQKDLRNQELLKRLSNLEEIQSGQKTIDGLPSPS